MLLRQAHNLGRQAFNSIHDQELVLEEKRLCDYGTDAARSEQAGQGSDQVEEKNGHIAHRRIVAEREIMGNPLEITIRQRHSEGCPTTWS